MEKQILFPILSSIKYNKLEQKDLKVEYEGKKIPQQLDFNFSDVDCTAVSPILNDDDDSIIDALFEKNHVLQARWRVMQQSMDILKQENERLKEQLAQEKTRCANYKKKLHYIQENQPIFEKLKQAYITLKNNEHSNRPSVEVKERSIQTCHEYNDREQQYELYKNPSVSVNFDLKNICNYIDVPIEAGFMAVKKKEFNELKQTVYTLKSLIISQPLSTFVLTERREAKYRKDIAEMFIENRNLKQLVVDQQLDLDSANQQIALRKTPKEINMLRKIIAKLEKQIRSCNTCGDKKIEFKDSRMNLNETEKKIVEHISIKYELKLQKHESPQLSPRIPSTKSTTPFYTPRTPSTVNATPYFTPRSGRIDGIDTLFINGVDTSRNGADTSRSGADTSRSGADTSRSGADTSRSGADTSRSGVDIFKMCEDNFSFGSV